jgi:hypothetical protein
VVVVVVMAFIGDGRCCCSRPWSRLGFIVVVGIVGRCVVVDISHLTGSGQGWPWPDPGPTRLAWGQPDPGPGPAESGLALRARVKGQGKWVGPGPARPLDSVCESQ